MEWKQIMKILYIFPHPDDESFGPARAISSQVRAEHEVYLLTLTRGGATKERFKYGYSIEEMGEVRFNEMKEVAKVLGLTEMIVLDLPDSGLKELDPREIEKIVSIYIEKLQPEIVITYPVHGISGFHDHLVIHAAVKRVYVELKEKNHSYLKRLAFFTLKKPGSDIPEGIHRLNYSTDEEIDCIINAGDEDMEAMRKALNCYKTYKDVIRDSKVMEKVGKECAFEIFQENYNPPLEDLFQNIS